MKTPEISWYNFTHPNEEAIKKRDKFLEDPINDCINCMHFYFNNDGSAIYSPNKNGLKHPFPNTTAKKNNNDDKDELFGSNITFGNSSINSSKVINNENIGKNSISYKNLIKRIATQLKKLLKK